MPHPASLLPAEADVKARLRHHTTQKRKYENLLKAIELLKPARPVAARRGGTRGR